MSTTEWAPSDRGAHSGHNGCWRHLADADDAPIAPACGHEAAGTVLAVGEGTSTPVGTRGDYPGLKPGRRTIHP